MLRTLFALAVGLVVVNIVSLELPGPMGFWNNYFGVAVGAAITGAMLRSRQWLFGAIVGVMFGGYMAAGVSLVFDSVKRNYWMRIDYHVYLVLAAHIIGFAIVGAAAAAAAPKLRLMLRR